MADSSLSTDLEVTKHGPATPAAPTAPSESVDQAAKVLVAIRSGAHGISDLSAATGVEVPQLLGLLSALAAAGLVNITGSDDSLSAELSETAENTLASSS
jgi:DNA-binding IclR family transcriptional regulator